MKRGAATPLLGKRFECLGIFFERPLARGLSLLRCGETKGFSSGSRLGSLAESRPFRFLGLRLDFGRAHLAKLKIFL